MEGTLQAEETLQSKKTNNQSLGEEIANAVSHGVGAGLAIAGTVLLIIKAATKGSAIDVVSGTLFGSSLIILYLFSCIYHSLAQNAKYHPDKIFRKYVHLSLVTYRNRCLLLLQ